MFGDALHLGGDVVVFVQNAVDEQPDKAEFFTKIKPLVRENGIVFFAFPAWQMPFGGHQQICKSKVSKLPFIHLLPNPLYKGILHLGKEKGCIVSPAGAHYDSENKTLVTANGPVRDFLEIRPGTVGIPEHASAEWQAWGVEGGIHLHGIKEHSSVEIINMLGQVVCRTLLESTETYIPMKSGVYIVRGDNSAVKVFVK